MKKELITHRLPKSPISELFRTLRTNIQFMNTKQGLRTVMITSTITNEGKSWVTSNLAVTFAQMGKKVLLVDCDLRKGRQFSIFGVSPTPGLSNYLSGIDSLGGECSDNIMDYIQETPVENLVLLPAGNVPPNPSELLSSERMQETIERLKKYFDIIIFDTTPSCLVTDAVILSRYVDTTILVAGHKKSKIEDIKKVKREIENVGGKIAGIVVNKTSMSAKKYGTSYYYYGSSNMPSKHSYDRKNLSGTYRAEELIKQNREEVKEETKENETEQETQEIINDNGEE